MKKTLCLLAASLCFPATVALSASAADCPGAAWNYGGTCQSLGLDTHRGTCINGDQYETLCDDAGGGRYRICRGTRICSNNNPNSNDVSASAADCPGAAWNYGGTCQSLGLDTHRGTCINGDQYETLCDDAGGGRYRICRGTRTCSNNNPNSNNECMYFDYSRNRPCPLGYINPDCQGDCGTRL